MACDPIFSNVSLLLAMDGANGSTTFVDTSSHAFAVTNDGCVQDNVVTPQFGATCGDFGGGNGYLNVPITAAGPLDLSGGNSFTIEGWIQLPAGPGNYFQTIYSDRYTNGSSENVGVLVLANYEVLGTKYAICLQITDGTNVTTTYFPTAIADTNWHYFAVVMDAATNTAGVWLDGVANTATSATPLTYPSSENLYLGIDAIDGYAFGGYMQQFRMTNGVARYVPGVNFTPPAAVFGGPCGATVPDVTNLSQAIAAGILEAAGFLVETSPQSSLLVIPGNVVSQSPTGGSSASAGSVISLSVSTGPAPIAVPDLIGLTEAAAILALTNVGLVPGGIGSAPSTTIAAGIVLSQNPGPGIPYPIYLASGSIVGFVVSTGPPSTDTEFDYEPTIISQYANSPTLLQWIANMAEYIDQSQNFANFLTYVWNVDTATGFGLDIWGKIVNVSRLINIPNTTPYVGFDIASESQPSQDWTPAGSSAAPYNNPPVGGAMYTGYNATTAYLLDDNSYRQLILAKAFANICSTTAPAINQILQNLYGVGQAYVLHSGVMAISYNFNFKPSPIQLAILQQSGVIPTPPGVAVTIVTP